MATAHSTRGIQLMLLGCLVLPMMDAAAKSMGESIAAGLIVLARFGVQSLLLAPLVWRTIKLPNRRQMSWHLKRSVSLTVATLCFFTAIQVMPIADALAIFFVMPLVVTLLAPWLLKESVGWHRLAAVAVGFVGAVIIVQPGQVVFGWRAFLPLGSALGFGLYLMYTRKLARSGDGGEVPPLTMQFYSGVISAIFMLLVMLLMSPFDVPMFELTMPQAWQWWRLILVGVFAAVGHVIVTYAFKYADASVLAPFQYAELLMGTILGWLLFGDIPMPSTVLGASILVASGLYVFHRERLHR